jgi:uncharacterized protein YaeQ
MAPNATIFRATLHIADLDRHYYEDHSITLARHPSETDERMMVRLLAFVLHADEALLFGRGLSTEGEPALWRKDLTGAIEQWIEVGLPDDKTVRQACGRAKDVYVYTYGGRGADLWWDKSRPALARCDNLTVLNLPLAGSEALARYAQRSMDLHCTIQEGQISIGDGTHIAPLELAAVKRASSRYRRGAEKR